MRLTAWVAIAALFTGCDDDVLNMQRADIGVRDAGAMDPLGLQAGMTFGYQARLTFRDTGNANEGVATYDLEVAIQSVEDRGSGQSSVTVTVTGMNTFTQDWTDTRDFDLWVARLGPSRGFDQIDLAPTLVPLDSIPEQPPGEATKALPQPGSFFLDVRDIEALRTAWNTTHGSRQPRVVDPQNTMSGRWLFSYDGAVDRDSVFFFPDEHRRRGIDLEFDPRGFLVLIREEVGAETGTPQATAEIELVSGP
ncbi:MAG: hypothetical protein AAFZ18_19425 [Myxococcota bacterium]